MKYLLLLAALLFATACNLGTRITEPVVVNPTRLAATSTTTIIDGREPTETPTLRPTTSSTQNTGYIPPTRAGVSLPPCTPRTDWTIYVVQPGDSLSRIAQRAGTTTAALVSANCLANPDSLSVGQQLRVPVPVPPPVTVTQPPRVSYLGMVEVAPYSQGGFGDYGLRPDTTVNLLWTINAPTLTQVEFYYTPTGAQNGSLIGVDTNMADGMSVSWRVPSSVGGRLHAVGFINRTMTVMTERNSSVYTVPSDVIVGGTIISVQPSTTTPDGIMMLTAGSTITLRWDATFPSSVNRVEFIVEENFNGEVRDYLRFVATDSYLVDGASTSWQIPRAFTGSVRALAYFNNGSLQGTDTKPVMAIIPF